MPASPPTTSFDFQDYNPFSLRIDEERRELRARAEVVIEAIARDAQVWKLSGDELRSMAWARFEGRKNDLTHKLVSLQLAADHPIRKNLADLWSLSVHFQHRSEETLRKVFERHGQEKLAVPLSGSVPRSFRSESPKTGSVVLIGNDRHAWQVATVPHMAPRFFGWYYVEFGPPTFWLSPTEFVEDTIVPPLYGPSEDSPPDRSMAISA